MAEVETLNKGILEEDERQEERLNELYEKKDLTEEEKKEFTGLKGGRKDRYQKRLDKMKSAELAARHEAEQERARREEAEKKLADMEDKKKVISARSIEETVEIDGKHYPTDRALKAMVEADEITDEEAWARKEERDEENRAARVVKKLKEDNLRESTESARAQDVAAVLKQYPHFDKKHPDFDPEDPLYREVSSLLANGYSVNPRGVSLAVRDAKRILRIQDDRPDITDDISLRSSNPPKPDGRGKEIQLSESEQEYVVRLYGNKINPKTGRIYTSEEAVAKAKKAKEAQIASRRVV